MPKQIYNLTCNSNSIEIKKNGEIIFEISMSKKTIDLKALYSNMKVEIDDYLEIDNTTHKFGSPKTDVERIHNNVYDFLSNLFSSLNKKFEEIKKRQDTSVFK